MKRLKTPWFFLLLLPVMPLAALFFVSASNDSNSAEYNSDTVVDDSNTVYQDKKTGTGGFSFFSPAPKRRYLELALLDQGQGYFSSSFRSVSILNILRVIKKAEGDKNIRGIILNTSGFHADQTTLWELRLALESFKASGKRVIAFIDNAGYDLYVLVSAADRIIMDEAGAIFFTGYVYGRGYYRDTLEKLGVGVRELRYLNYKTAMESFTRSDLSEADRRQQGAYLDDIFGLSKKSIKEARSWDDDRFNTILNSEFMYSAFAAKERGLVDGIGRSLAVIRAVEEIEGAPIDGYLVYGNSLSSLTQWSSLYRVGRTFSSREIAVVYASGETDLDRAMGTRSLAGLIRDLAAKKRVKAIVVRIDSPGGSAEAADYLAEAIRDARHSVPVVVSMGSVAASGGYWASMYANRIVASPFTITGSIGVIAGWFFDQGLNQKLGISVDFLKRGDHADLGAGMILPARDLSPAEEKRYRQLILDLYGNFVQKVAEGRNMPVDTVEKLAQGRVYSGISARDLGLVDSLGGFWEALETARDLAEISEDQKVVYKEYPKQSFIENFINRYLFTFVSQKAGMGKTKILEALEYRVSQNGRVMPILPLETGELLLGKR